MSKKYRLRPLISDATKGEKMHGITLEGTGNLKDYLIVTYDADKTPPQVVRSATTALRAEFGQVVVIPNTWEFCVFEEVPDDEG